MGVSSQYGLHFVARGAQKRLFAETIEKEEERKLHLHPDESTDVGNLEGLGGEVIVGHGGDGLLNLRAVEVVGMELVVLPDVGAGVKGDGGRALSGDGAGRLLDGLGRSGSGDSREGEGGSGDLHCDVRAEVVCLTTSKQETGASEKE